MKRRLLFLFIGTNLLALVSFSQQDIRSNYTGWYTFFYNSNPNVKVQISFSLASCKTDGSLMGYSYWRINNILSLPRANVKFYFDYLSCDGKINKEFVTVNLEKAGIDAYIGNHFIGYKIVKYPYNIVFENYNKPTKSNGEIENTLSTTQQRINKVLDESKEDKTLKRPDNGTKASGMGNRAEIAYPKPEVLASTNTQQIQEQTQDYIDKANSTSDPIQQALNTQLAKINTFKQGGNNQQQLSQIAILEQKQTEENTKTLINGISSLINLFSKSENKSKTKNVKVTTFDKALEYYNAGNFLEAMNLYKKAANKGNATAMLNIGLLYENGKGVSQSSSEALIWFNQAASKNNTDAMTKIGEYYEEGKGADKKIDLAIEWYKKAADLKNQDACFNIGNLYFLGEEVPLNDETAFYWFKKAAELGEIVSEDIIGEMYLNGTGVEKNTNLAVYWIRKSAESGYGRAMHDLGWLYGTGNGVDEDFNMAFEWFKKGAETGHSESIYKLGLLYEKGLGTSKDEKIAFEKINIAAEKNFLPAIIKVAKMHLEGVGTPKNYTKALSLFMKASNLGDPEAMDFIGNIYAKGMGVSLDYKTAFIWFKKSAELNYPEAMFDLALMYEHGFGVTMDKSEAIKWYKKASENGNELAKSHLEKIEKQN